MFFEKDHYEYKREKLKDIFIDNDSLKTINEENFLDFFDNDHFLVVFMLPITATEKFLRDRGFNREAALKYRHSNGFVIEISPYIHNGQRGYYITDIFYPEAEKKVSLEFEFFFKITINYYDPTYLMEFKVIVSIDEETREVTDMEYSSELFGLNHDELHDESTFIQKLNSNISRINEEPLASLKIDGKNLKNVSCFDVLYIFDVLPNAVKWLQLSEIVETCGFNPSKLISNTMHTFLDIRNVFNADELKVIEMTYI